MPFHFPIKHVVRVVSALLITFSLSYAADLTPEVIVAKHLESLGTAQARNAVKSRVVQGPATYHIVTGGYGTIDGKLVLATEGQKVNFLLKVNTVEFHGEQIIYDGDKISVAGTRPDHSRTEFGDFLLGEDIAVRENLLGGVWRTGWPLLDVEAHKAKLHYEGTKKLDGRDYLVLAYQPRKNTDLDIFLYFDPETYRHIATIYRASRSSGIGRSDISTARRQLERYYIEERFADFQTTDGLTLPTRYNLHFTFENQSGSERSVEWR
jgi:hypothetical protein